MSFSSGEQLDALLDRIPLLAGPRRVEELSGGLTNRNIKVTMEGKAAGQVYVARFSDAANNHLAIDREAEFVNSQAAATAGVGAPVIDFRPDLGVLLVGFIEGATLTNEDFQRPGMIARAADSMRRLHSGPRFCGRFDMFETQAAYHRIVRDNGFRLPADYSRHEEKFGSIRAVLRATESETVPCNNDLLAGNFIDDGSTIWLIDYEYSGNGDPCFEMGNMASECGLSVDQLDELVSSYYGKSLRHKFARARLQSIAARYGWTLWGCIQSASSPIEFDFWDWAMQRYEGAVAEFADPGFDRLLGAAQSDN